MGDHWNGQAKDKVTDQSERADVRGRAEHEDIDEFDEFTEDQDDDVLDVDVDEEDATY